MHPRDKFLVIIIADDMAILDLPLNEKVRSGRDEVIDNAGGTSRVTE